MGLRNLRFLVSIVYVIQVLSFGSAYAQAKPSAKSITVYKTPT